ncbi:MAG: 2-oxo acid dehydrogenase subunit E2 [Planctomycetaceae bacterium]|nr:2-oxo acid dehydrogenase subunit E2 [Planctomycetaceae bacterium]
MAVTVLKMSSLSMTMVEGVVVQWHKKVGDPVRRDEPLLDVETDKVVKEVTSPATGTVAKLYAAEGAVVPVGEPLCEIETDATADQPPAGQSVPASASGPASAVPTAATPVVPVIASTGKKVKSSPLARRVAADRGVDYTALTGTGPGGLIVKRDVEKAAARSSAASDVQLPGPVAPPAAQDEVIPFAGLRRRTAEVMLKSVQNTATVSAIAEVNMGAVGEYRKYLPVSYTAYVIAAASRALAEPAYKTMNSQLSGDTIVIKGDVNISVSVATGKSLVTPVLRNADRKNLLTIGDELAARAARAREGGLEPEDMQGGTFTITNSGVFGSLLYTPIINYPQAGIIGMGKIMKTPVVIDDAIVIAPMMYLCISYDHRLIDGEVGAPFLQRVKFYLEHPQELVAPGKEKTRQ